ncbi:MAG TPA: 3-hydroxyacyl-CoA dehydrogenase NAD-binding domain-containing protein [Pseudonocardiaceae bacterium]|nr:3-hydroxyacyl-CoA dehydrogenase NAD-binding domain-containing protein [Pseudonocardiaceae bacterium]
MTGLVVIGAGTMGRGIATVAVRAGYDTTIVDVDGDVLATVCAEVERRATRDGALSDAGLGALHSSRDIEVPVAGAAVVIEAVPEVDTIKRELFARLAALAPPAALLATNTSTMSVTALAEAAGGSPRVVGMHFFNPAHRMALVEIVVGAATSDTTVADARALALALGKDPVLVRDVPGFITSRLGLLLGNEAMRILEEGVASAADIDKALRLGYGHPMGPLELADLVGLDARLNNLRSMVERSGSAQYQPPAILLRLVAEGRLGKKTGAGFYDY